MLGLPCAKQYVSGSGSQGCNPGKCYNFKCEIVHSGPFWSQKMAAELDVKKIIDVTLTEYGEHCSQRPKVEEAVADSDPRRPK